MREMKRKFKQKKKCQHVNLTFLPMDLQIEPYAFKHIHCTFCVYIYIICEERSNSKIQFVTICFQLVTIQDLNHMSNDLW
jgi:hypothetical protein